MYSLRGSWHLAGSLKLAMAGVFIRRTLENTINHGFICVFFLTPECSNFNSTEVPMSLFLNLI